MHGNPFDDVEDDMDLPKNKDYPASAGQCNGCGGHGCTICKNRGWLTAGDSHIRKCLRDACGAVIPPAQVAVYCTNECAIADA